MSAKVAFIGLGVMGFPMAGHLKAKGWGLTHVMNLTDVDDKTIRGANEAKQSLRDFTTKYAELFFQ